MTGLTHKPHGRLNKNGPELRKEIERVRHKNFTIWYDAGNIFYYSGGKLNPVNDVATIDGMVPSPFGRGEAFQGMFFVSGRPRRY